MTVRKRRSVLINKIPESIEKSSGLKESEMRERVINDVVDAMLDGLNGQIGKHDMTFEEAFYATEIVELSILSKYINFRIGMRLAEGSAPRKNGRAGIA